MSEEIAKFGLFYDDLYALRVLEPDVASGTQNLVDECGGYAQKLDEFKLISEKFIAITESLSQKVDHEKMRTIGVQTLLKSMTKQRATEQQELQNKIMERTMELERLKVELQYLQRIEAEQQEVFDNLYQQ